MIKALLLTIISLTAACRYDPCDRKCVRSHYERQMTMMYVDSTNWMLVPIDVEVCDEVKVTCPTKTP
jgi:hypothetical protein